MRESKLKTSRHACKNMKCFFSSRTLCAVISLLLLLPLTLEVGAFMSYNEWSAAADAMQASSEELLPSSEAISSAPAIKAADGDISLGCPSAILIEVTGGEILFEKNADERMPIASVTKIMTILLIMEAIDGGLLKYDDIITISDVAASMGGSQAYLEPGEQITCRDLLKAVVVASANDAAVAFAEHISGSVEAFIQRMNKRAAELGMSNTDFLNVTGLDDTEIHYSTARDVSLMSAELLTHEAIKEYTTIWMDSIRNGQFGLVNTNKLVRFYNGTTGLKTGYTSRAKFCVSASAERNGLQLVAVVLGADTSDGRFSDAKAMLNYGFANYAFYKPDIEPPAPLKVLGGKAESVKLTFNIEGMLCKKSDISNMSCEVTLSESLCAPVDKGQLAGKIIYKLGNTTVSEVNIVTAEEVGRLTFFDILGMVLSGGRIKSKADG